MDVRSGESFSYYAQHVLASGVIDSNWTPAATGLCLGTTDDLHQVTCRDGAGGVYAGWVDARGRDTDIYLQHFNGDGSTWPAWPAGGLAICTAAYSQYNLDVVADHAGGVYLAWQDFRAGTDGDIYVQHVTAQGTLAAGWAAGGLGVCSQEGAQSDPRVAADGAGGAFVVWEDRRDGHLALWGQHLAGNGVPVLGWPEQGAPMTAVDSSASEVAPALMASGDGAFTLAWRSETGATTALHAERIPANWIPGQGSWPQVLTLADGAVSVGDPALFALANGATLVSWSEQAPSGSSSTLRISRITADGVFDSNWPAGGRVACTSALSASAPCFAATSDSSVVLAWEDYRAGNGDIYAQRLTSTGEIASGWPPNGLAVCSASGSQYAPSLIADTAGGVVATWADADRSVAAGILASRMAGPQSATLAAAAAHPGHAHIVWRLTPERPGYTLAAWRQEGPDGLWNRLASLTSGDSGSVVLDDRSAPEGAQVAYRLSFVGEGYTRFMQPVTLQIPVAPTRLALERAWALPRQNTVMLRLSVPMGEPPTMELLDVMGRRIERQALRGIEPGVQQVAVRVSASLPSGVYFVRVMQRGEARSAKLVFVR